MSVIDTNKIDGIGKSKDNVSLVLLISDHLDWSDEKMHLFSLQAKINAYLEYLETKQYVKIYPEDQFQYRTIEIHFKYPITEKCSVFLDTVGKQIRPLKIKLLVQTADLG